MNRSEFAEATGASFRQIDYWFKAGIPITIGEETPSGSGNYRTYDPATVQKIQTLVAISRTFEGSFSVHTLRRIFAEYDKGEIKVGKGIFLKWDILNERIV